MKLKISLRVRAIQTIIVNFSSCWQSKVSLIRPLIEEADEEFAEKHYALIDLDSLRNVLETMKKVNASISKSNNRIAICLTIN
ncbi:hypothetical protein [Bacillus sp. ISL-77]|uniref:hypothetical protein n=1 Tax=Bacillus sp. ISL-77 TaxID=2819138 RepID=UPI002035F617|nr:hypothetical protein [Bacillus sp. ISL-77]